MKTLRMLSIAFSMLMLLGSQFGSVDFGFGSPQTLVYIDPEYLLTPVCDDFTVDIDVADVANLYGFEIWLNYDTNLMDALSAGVYPPFSLYQPMIYIDDPAGYVYIWAQLMPPEPPLFGNVLLAWVQFHCTGEGATPLMLQYTNLWDPIMQPIFHEVRHGFVQQVEVTWKPSFEDYAPSGVPDFDQRQDGWFKLGQWTYCGPTAVANSLWWMDSRFDPWQVPPPTVSDGYPLVTAYQGMWDDHDPQNVQPFVSELAGFMDTDGIQSGDGHLGTKPFDMAAGISSYLYYKGLSNCYSVNAVKAPPFGFVEHEIERCEDVILLLGFWQEDPYHPGQFVRFGGHYITAVGVNSQLGLVAFSDPILNNAEPPPDGNSGPGQVSPPPPHGHPQYLPPPPPPEQTLHNDAMFVSHDLYWMQSTFTPGGLWGPMGYNMSQQVYANFQSQNAPDEFQPFAGYYNPMFPVFVEVEYAITVSPKRIIAAGSLDQNVYAFEFDGSLLWSYNTGADVASVAMSATGEYVVAGSLYNQLCVFNKSGNLLWQKPIPVNYGYDGGWAGTESKTVAISGQAPQYTIRADGEYIAAACTDKLYLYDNEGTLIWDYAGEFRCVGISFDGNYLVAREYPSGRIYLFSSLYDGKPGWNITDGTPVWSKGIDAFWVAIDGLGEYVAASTYNKVYLYDRAGTEIWQYTLNKMGYVRVDMPWHGRSLVAVNDDPSNQLGCEMVFFDHLKDQKFGWNSTDGTPLWTFTPTPASPNDDLYTVAISANGDYTATGGATPNAPNHYLYTHTKDSTLLQSIPTGVVQSVDLTFDGMRGAAGDNQGTLWFFNTNMGLPLWSYNIGSPIHSVAIEQLYTGSLSLAQYHDVIVQNITCASAALNPWRIIAHANVTVKNKGDFTETFEVSLFAQNRSTIVKIGAQALTLISQASETLTFYWNATDVPTQRYSLFASASPVQDEYLLEPPLGDCNRDGLVDKIDAQIVMDAWATTPGNPQWDRRADVYQDNKINIKDQTYVANAYLAEFGNSYFLNRSIPDMEAVSGAIGITGYKLLFKETMRNYLGLPVAIDYSWRFRVDKWDGVKWVDAGISGSTAPVVGYVIPALATVDLPYSVYLLPATGPNKVTWCNWLKISFSFHWTYSGFNFSTTNQETKLHVHPGDVTGAGSMTFPYLEADGICDISDAALIGAKWQQLVPPGTNPTALLARADITGDGIVDISDAAVIGTNWQNQWANTPPP